MQPSLRCKPRRSLRKCVRKKSISHSYIHVPNLRSTRMTVLFGDNEPQLCAHLKNVLVKISQESIQERNVFNIGVSGGSALKFLTHAILSFPPQYDFSRWTFFFCDERVVPETSADSTFGSYKSELICRSQLSEEQFVKIKEDLDADKAAADYIQQMETYFPRGTFPIFDFLLLGMGPDGHTCSLFVGHKLLEEDQVWVAPILDSPKPPPQRITFTLPLLKNARNCVFVIAGQEKGPMAKRVFVDKDQTLPAARVNPISGTLYLIIENGLIN